ncbi:MAG: PAS domain-containing protein, partial [Silvanigrellaceae bacterium]|nr:PAS domain-containing protein [Silvanigrellaceae bacterium]
MKTDQFLYLKKVINSFPAHVYWKTIEGVYLGCNTEHAISAGLKSSEEIIGKTDYDLSWKDKADEIRVHDKNVLQKMEMVSVEEVITLPGQEKLSTFLSQKMPLYEEDGSIVGIIGISQNITELKDAKNLLESALNEQKIILTKYKDFICNQEHDIRTPIACIAGLSEALMDIVSEPEALEMVKAIYESAKAQKAYHNSMLDGIYLFEHQTEHITRRFEPKILLEEVKSIYACAISANNLQFNLIYDNAIPRFLWGDWFRLEQILVSLLSNAVKFTESGGQIELRCRLDSFQNKEIILSIEIEDSGIGIDAAKLNTIFEPFMRLSLSNLGKYEGRGLGLTFVKKMISELQGEIHVNSILG